MKQRLLLGAAALPLLAGLSAAQQFTTLAADSFDYPAGMDLGGLSGGQGFLVPWYAGQAGMDATITAPGFDAVGNKATTVPQMVGPFEIKAENYRRLDLTGFDLITDPDDGPSGAVFGKDGAIIWVTFVMQRIPGGDDTFGGLSLFTHFGSNGGEKLFMGSPFQFFDLGIDDQAGCVFTVPGTSVDQLTRLVYRLDFLPGDERVRMWVDPMVDHPVTAPDLDVTVPDFRFNEIRIGSGDGGTVGSMGGYEFDDIRIECQDCLPPPVQNFTGNPAQISVVNGGSQALALDATVANAGLPYVIVGSASGTTPGLLLDGLNLPVNVDLYTFVTLDNANTAVFQNTVGVLDAAGQAAAAIAVPPGSDPALIGLQLNHAYAVLQLTPTLLQVVFTSDPVSLDFIL